MRLCDAIYIIDNIDSDAFDDEQKGLAIMEVKNAETLNSVTKKDLLKVINWLFDKCFEVV